jgi:predicted GH43/DUF377 family glycosyl hydrolase
MKVKRLIIVSVAILLVSLLVAIPAAAAGGFVESPVPVLERDVTHNYENSGVGGASVLYDSGSSLYKMWYSALGDNGISICYAESNDGLVWNKPYPNPVLQAAGFTWEGTGVGGPSVIIDNLGIYEMWYTGIDGTTASIGWASSPDGITWTRNPSGLPVLTATSSAWDADSVAFPSVIQDGGLYKMWYTGQDTSQGLSMIFELAIGYASSDDGITWTKAPNPVLTKTLASWDSRGVGACSVKKSGASGFVMYYTGFTNHDEIVFDVISEIGEAVCYDGIGLAWTKTGSPVLEADAIGGWDEEGVAAPSVVMLGGATKIWFTAADDTEPLPIFSIGYAEQLPEQVPASSNLSTGLMIGGFAVFMFVAYFGVRRYQFRSR